MRKEGSEVERLLADNTLAQKLLDWKPSISLEKGLKQTIEWVQQHPGRYRTGVYVI
jgi:dTDP-glucose 4,6-dehydratase